MVMIVALLLTLLMGLSFLRRVVEPACPSCAAKSWTPVPNALHCAECGWSNVATVKEIPQYELVLQGSR